MNQIFAKKKGKRKKEMKYLVQGAMAEKKTG